MTIKTFSGTSYFQNCTPLLLAATYNHSEIFTALREAGADMLACDIKQQSIFHHTCQVAP